MDRYYIPGKTKLDADLLYKILPATEWQQASQIGQFRGSGIDHADGFIHLSGPDQVAQTYQKHFAGAADLMIFGIMEETLGQSLRWEVSRGGLLFPHVYGVINVEDVKTLAIIPNP